MSRLAMILVPESTLSSIALTLDMVRIASRYPEALGCTLDLFSLEGETFAASSGVSIKTQVLPKRLSGYAGVILPGFFAPDFKSLLATLSNAWSLVIEVLLALPEETLLGASCYGNFVLAESGLLDHHRATTTWWFAHEFEARYPKVKLDVAERIIDSGRIITAGAMTAHAHMVLRMLYRLYGHTLARHVGRIMLMDSGSSQRPFMSLRRDVDDALVAHAVRYLSAHYSEAIMIESLAKRLNVSYRTLHRRFKAATFKSPMAYLQALRIESAKAMLEDTQASVDDIAHAVGYSDVPVFRSVFKREVGLLPSSYRRMFSGDAL